MKFLNLIDLNQHIDRTDQHRFLMKFASRQNFVIDFFKNKIRLTDYFGINLPHHFLEVTANRLNFSAWFLGPHSLH